MLNPLIFTLFFLFSSFLFVSSIPSDCPNYFAQPAAAVAAVARPSAGNPPTRAQAVPIASPANVDRFFTTPNVQLPPELAVTIIALLPKGLQYVALYERLAQLMLDSYLYCATPDQAAVIKIILGQDGVNKIVQCMADTSMALTPADLDQLSHLYGRMATKGSNAILAMNTGPMLQYYINEYKLADLYPQMYQFLLPFIIRFGQVFSQKALACFFKPNSVLVSVTPSQSLLNSRRTPFQGNALLRAIPYGVNRYSVVYSRIGSFLGSLVGNLTYPKRILDYQFFDKTAWIRRFRSLGVQIGNCLAVNGFVPNPQNPNDPVNSLLYRGFSPLVHFIDYWTNRLVNGKAKLIDDQATALIARFGFSRYNDVLLPLVRDLVVTVGLPVGERIFQCVLVKSQFDPEDIAALRSRGGAQGSWAAELSSADEEFYGRRHHAEEIHRHVQEAMRKIRVQVEVNV